MVDPQLTATVLNPGSPSPWRLEIVLSGREGEAVAIETVEHSGVDYEERVGPVIDRMRQLARETGLA